MGMQEEQWAENVKNVIIARIICQGSARVSANLLQHDQETICQEGRIA